MSTVWCKATLGDDTQKMKIPSPHAFADFVDAVAEHFEVDTDKLAFLRFSYNDADGSPIEFKTDGGFLDAISKATPNERNQRFLLVNIRFSNDSTHGEADISGPTCALPGNSEFVEECESVGGEFVAVSAPNSKSSEEYESDGGEFVALSPPTEASSSASGGGYDPPPDEELKAVRSSNLPPSAPMFNSSRGGRKLELCDLATRVRSSLDSARNVVLAQNGVAVFFGSTGAGKSTTINFLCGAKIESLPAKSKYDKEIKLDVCEVDRANYLRIGHQRQSETKTICVRKATTGICCCDMPGSNDTDPVDDIVNCVMRANVLRSAHSIHPVFVLSVKDLEGSKGQNMVDAVEYVADCFESSKDFSALTMFVTHASDSDVMTIGGVQEALHELLHSSLACGPQAYELLAYMSSEFSNALQELENKKPITASLRVVKPLQPETREDLLRTIEQSRCIQDPKKAFRATLSDDAKKSLRNLAGEQHKQIMTCFGSDEFSPVAGILLDLCDIALAIEPDLCEISRKWIVAENQNLFQHILGQVSDSMNTTLELLNVGRDIERPFDRFKRMQVIYQSCTHLLKGWVTEDMLRHDYGDRSISYVKEQMRIKDWSMIEMCTCKMRLIDGVMGCFDSSTAANQGVRDILEATSKQVLVDELPAPHVIASTLSEIDSAQIHLSGERKQQASVLMEEIITHLTERLETLLCNCLDLGSKVANSCPAVEEDNCELHSKVSRLYKLTGDSRLDSFLPTECKKDGNKAYFKRFREGLPLHFPDDRKQLLQHSNLLACLSKAEDEDLGAMLKRRKEELRDFISSVVAQDFKFLEREWKVVLWGSVDKAPGDVELDDANLELAIQSRRQSIDSFYCAFTTVIELRQVDEMTGKMTWAQKLSEFFRTSYGQGLERSTRQIDFNSSLQPADILLAVVVLELCASQKLLEVAHGIIFLEEDIEFLSAVHVECKRAIEKRTAEMCDKYCNNIGSVDFKKRSGWKWADEASVALSRLRHIPIDGNICIQKAEQLKDCWKGFIDEHIEAFEAASKNSLRVTDCNTGVRTINTGSMIDAIEPVLPVINGAYRNLPIDASVLDTLKDTLFRTETELVTLANGARDLSGSERFDLLENIKRMMDGRRIFGIEEASAGLANAKQQLIDLFSAKKKKAEEELLQGSDIDFDHVVILVTNCAPADKRGVVDSANSSARRRTRELRALAQDLCEMDMQQRKALEESLRVLKSLQDSKLFDLLDEQIQKDLISVLQALADNLKQFVQTISVCLEKQNYSYGFESALLILKQVRKTYPTYFKEAKEKFQRHLNLVLENPNVQNAVTMLKKLHKSKHFKEIFGDDYDSFLDQLQEKISMTIHDMQERVKDSIHKELAAQGEGILKRIDQMISDLSCCSLCSAEVQTHKELKEQFALMGTERKQTMQDYLEQRDWAMAVKLLSTVGESHRTSVRHALRSHIAKLKQDAENAESSGCQSNMKPIFEDISNLLTALKENSTDVETHRDMIETLEKSLTTIEHLCEEEFARIVSVIASLAADNINADFAMLSPALASLKRLMQIPPQSVRKQNEIQQYKEQAVSGIVLFCKSSAQFMENQLHFVDSDNQQVDLKTLKPALDKVEKYQDNVLKELENLVRRYAPSVEVLSFSNFAQSFRDKLSTVCKGKQARIVQVSREGFKSNTLTMQFTTLNRVAVVFEGEYTTVLKSAVIEVKAILRNLSDAALRAMPSCRYDEVTQVLNQLNSAKGSLEHCEILDLKVSVEEELQRVMAPMFQDVADRAAKVSGPAIRDAALDLQELRSQVGNVPQLQAHVVKSISGALSRLKEGQGEEFISELGQVLMSNEWGKYIISEQPMFKFIKGYMYTTKIPSLQPEQAVKDMKGQKLDTKRLIKCVEDYNKLFTPMLGEYIKSTESFQARKSKLLKEVQRWKSGPSNDTTELVTMVCILFTLIKSGERYSQGNLKCIIAPHTIQIASILRLLGVDTGGPTVLDHCKSIVTNFSLAGQRIHNHVMQVPTGEGKSIVLGIVASVFALQGIYVDCVCYSKYLSHRDFADFSELFEALEIADKVRYLTFQDLCESHIQGVRQAALTLLGQSPRGTSGSRAASAAAPERGRILLIDEVDVFFKRQFYGGTLNAGALLQSPNIEKLIRLVWSKRNSWGDSETIKATEEFKAVAGEFAAIEPIIAWASVAMAKNVKSFGTPRYEVRGGKIGYVINHVFDSSASYPNRTIFAYLHENEVNSSNITEEAVMNHMGIEIRCGEFSYASIPNRYYRSVFGVTGTLTTLPEPDKEVLKTEFKVERLTVAPSVYGKTNLDFNFEEPQHVVVEESVPFWHRKIAAVVTEAAVNKRAVLVCFKNDDELDAFAKATSLPNIQVLTSRQEDTDLDAIQGIVSNATMPKKITLLTRKYGRGVDFVCNSKEVNSAGGVMMVQTFYSSTLSEEAQIKGRVARQGECGSYRLILAADQVEHKFGVKITGLTRADLKLRLHEAREKKVADKIKERNLRKAMAEQKDANAWALVESLLGGQASGKRALLDLTRNALSAPKRTYIVILDVSGSMSSLWGSLAAAFNAFLDALLSSRSHADAVDTLLTIVLFDNIAKTTLRRESLPKVPRLAGRMPDTGGRGYTCFEAAFGQCCREVAAETEPGRMCNVVFMTDGEGGDPSRVVASMLTAHGRSIARYDCIPFGREAQAAQVLETVQALFTAHGVPTRTMQSNNAGELADAFATCASDDILHMN